LRVFELVSDYASAVSRRICAGKTKEQLLADWLATRRDRFVVEMFSFTPFPHFHPKT
jgi:hypothetical protein